MIPTVDLLQEYEKAELLLEQGDLRRAADMCRDILDTDPAFAHGYHLMSSLFRTTGNLEKALNFSQLAIQIEPMVAAFHFQQGQVCFALGDWASAAESFEKASLLDVQNPLPLILLSAARLHMKDYDAAQSLLARARIISDIPEIDEHEAFFLLARGDQAGAEKKFDRVIARNPDSCWGYIHKGRLLLERGQDNEAHGYFAKALNINEKAYEALHYMALIAQKAGDNKTAVHYVMQAIQINSSLFPSLMLLALLLGRGHDYASAEQVYLQAMTLKADHPDVVQGLMDMLIAQHRLGDALAYVEHVLVAKPEHATMQYFRAILKGQNPDASPLEYLMTLFNSETHIFSALLAHVNHNKVPQLIADALLALPLITQQTSLSLLDLGCAHGAIAEACKAFTHYRVGVDLSEYMLEKAIGRQLYNELYRADAFSYITSCERVFDVVVVSSMFAYIGNVQPFLQTARRVMSASGVLVFTVEKEESITNFRLNLNGRYTHSKDYIDMVARHEGYRLLSAQDVILRVENGRPIKGWLFILQKLPLH